MPVQIQVDQTKLVSHVKRVCKRNLKTPANICFECPFLPTILEYMDLMEWSYHKEIADEKTRIGAAEEG